MMFTLSAPALAESTNALMQLSINSRSSIARLNEQNSIPEDAKTLNIADGDIEVSVSAEGVQTATQGGQTYTGVFVVTGTSTTNKLVIKGDSGTAANVYLKDLHITVSSGAAVSVSNNVDLYIEGSSVLQSGENCAGIQKEDDGQLTIDGSGSLEATGGESGAGIGGASGKPGNNITINGGTITASGKAGKGWGAGIGGGKGQGGSNITIRGGNVKAIPGAEAAGIGGGFKGNGTDISIEGGTVYAESGGGNGGTAAIGGGRVKGNGENIQITGGDITLKKAGADDIGIGGNGIEIPVADTFGGSLTYLDADGNKDTTKTNIEKYGPVVNGKAVNSLNKDKILNGALRYDPATKILSLNTDAESYIGNLTIYAPNTTVDLNGGEYSAHQGKLVIEDAADVTLTSTEARAVVGDANITCTGKLRITCENIAVYGNLTVNNASSVELIGKNDNGGTVTGAAVFNNTGEVTIQNKDATKGAAHSVTYNGKDYVYFTTADGEQNDPRITPISTAADASYLHIVPSKLHSITVPEGCTVTLDGKNFDTAHAGQTVTVTAPDKGDHFEFAGWTISPDSVTLTDADKLTATFTMPDGDVKLENSYNQLYDVTVLKGTATPSFAKEGTPITITADTIPGRKFERWDVLNDKVTLANKNSNTTTFNMPAGEVQVEAKYKALQSITVNDGTYTVNGETTTEAVKGDKIVATANPAPEGEKFAGWNVVGVDGLTDEQKAASPIEFEMPKNGVALTAQYKTLHNIVVNKGTYTVNGTDDKQAVEGDKIAIKAAERPGYQFVRWEVVPDNVTITGVNNEEATFIMPNENVELKARYNKLYTITVDGGHADVTSALTGKEITVDADVPDGKKFMGWKADGITLTPAQQQSKHITFFMPEGNVTLTAEYKTLHTVTVIGANGTSTVLPDTYIEGDTVTVNAEKYGIPAGEFDSWESNDIRLTTDKRQSPTLTFKMVDKNVTLIAVPKTLFTITVTGGTVNGQSTTARVKAGDWVTIDAEDKGSDWKFIEWKLTGPENFTLDTSQSTVQFQMPSGDVTLEAVQMEYRTVTINNGNSSTVDEKALHGDSITVTADEVDGKRFVGWTYKSSDMTFNLTNDELGEQTLNFTVPEGDVTLTANYKQLYTVTVDGEPAGTVIEGEKVHVKANVPEDHEFVKWTSNVFLNGHDTDEEFDFVMPVPGQNVELTSETSQLYYVTINDQGADEPTQTFVVKAGDTVYLEAAGRDGWKFIDWEGDVDLIFDNEDHTKAHFTVPSNTNVTVTAKYMKYRTITVNGGTVNDKTTITDALREQEVEIKAVYDPEEQVFDHWEAEGPDGWALTEEQKGADSFTLKVPKGNVTLKAVYKTLHTVTVINGTARNGETTIKAVAGEKITLTPNLPDDQEFDCWYSEEINLREDQRKTPELTFKMRDFDITIEAKSKQLYFVELADDDTTANGVSGKVEVKSGEKVTIFAPEREGWKFIRWEVSDNAYLDDATASEAHFYMPSGNVSVKAVYYEYHTITMTDDKGTAYNEKGEEITRAVQGDVITIKAKKDREDHEFNRWVITPDNGTLVGKNDPEATFTMPDEAVVVDAKYKHLQGITVNGGAAYYMDGTPVETAKAGETIVIMAEDRSKDGLRFAYWEVNSDNVTVEGGEKATFEMAKAPVELTAHYEAQITYSNDPAIFDEGVGLHEDIVWEKVGDTVSITAVLDNSTDEDDIGTFPGMTFDYWEIVTPENLNVTSGLNSETITFEVPECEVKLIAHWKDTTTVTPAEPLDPGFPVEPEAPAADGSGAVIGVAAAGAAIWGGYEITTRVILNDLLPEGAAIPTNRGELAMLIWTQKGKPEPAAEPAFTDVSDTELAKAAQWCVEQGLLTAEDGKFEPDGRTPKWRVIQVWNQAFPKE
mgnify:CR=1 FL=1